MDRSMDGWMGTKAEADDTDDQVQKTYTTIEDQGEDDDRYETRSSERGMWGACMGDQSKTNR